MAVKKMKKTSQWVWLRRTLQTVFVLLFLYLFLQTAFNAASAAAGRVDFYFNMDPLVLVTVWLGGHAAAAALLLSLITVGVTLIFGRWFCGWFCPFGALHNLVSNWRGGSKKERLQAGGYSPWQRSKYYVLIVLLIAALVGANLAGWLDPFSFFYRSMTMAVFPAVNAGLQHFFDLIYRLNPGVGSVRLTAVSEPVYRWLRYYFLTLGQPHYFWSMVFGVLFGVVIALNFYRARFWCKYICPLGALLGVVGKNPLLRLKVDPDFCGNCRLCLVDCQGGANPNGEAAWKPSECMFCLNCQSNCPSDAIRFKFEIPGAKVIEKAELHQIEPAEVSGDGK
jgi:polyferredoxin